MLLCLVFIVRKVSSVLVRVLFGMSREHPYWNPLEEIVVKVIAFGARNGSNIGPRLVIHSYARIQRIVAGITKRVHVEDVHMGLNSIEGLDGVWITLDGVKLKDHVPKMLVFYIHGGGYNVGCSSMYVNAHGRILHKLADEHNIHDIGILSIEYPKAPEVKYPLNVEFLKKAFDYVVYDLGIPQNQIIVEGDSAGGQLAINVCHYANDMNAALGGVGSPLAGTILISPWVNHSCESDSHDEQLHTDFIAGRSLLADFSNGYCDSSEMACSDPHISALCHEYLSFLPPTWLSYGTREVFHDDLLLFKENLELHGNPILWLHRGNDCPHIYPLLYPLFKKDSSSAHSDMAAFAAECFRGKRCDKDIQL